MERTMKVLMSLCVALVFAAGCDEVDKEKAKAADDSLKPLSEDSGMGGETPASAADLQNPAANPADPKDPSCPACAPPEKEQTIAEFINGMGLPEVLATVGDNKITRQDVIHDLENGMKSQMPGFNPSKPMPQRMLAGIAANMKQIVDSTVSRKVILEMAEKDGIKPSPQLIEKQFDKFVGKMSPEQKAGFEKQLAAGGSSIAKKRAEAAADKDAQVMAAINEWIETKVVPSLKIDDAAAKKFYDEHKKDFEKPGMTSVAHILIRPEAPSPDKAKGMSEDEKKAFEKAADEKAKKKAEKVLSEIKKDGSNFAELAKKNSACPSAAEGGGLPPFDKTGMTARGPMDKAFTAAAMALKKKGDISGVVKSPYGYHIIKLLNRTETSSIPFDNVKDNLKKYLESKALNEKIPSLIDEEKKKIGVKIFVK